MKNRNFFMVICLTWTMAIQAQVSESARRIQEKLQAFVASGEYHVNKGDVIDSDEVTGSRTTVYGFSQIFGIEDQNFTDITLMFPHLKELENMLRSESIHADEVIVHNAGEGAPLIPGIQYSYGSNYGSVSRKIVFGNQQNIRILSFNEPNGFRYAVILMWEQTIKKDNVSGNNWMMNGSIFEIYGKNLEGSPLFQPYYNKQDQTSVFSSSPDSAAPKTYEELLAKVKQTCNIYKRETSGGKTAAVVILHKMCDGYPRKLTRDQYFALIEILSPFTETAMGQRHKDMFAYTCYTLYKKSEVYEEPVEVKERPAMIISATISTEQLHKYVSYNGLIMNESADLQMADCQISGTAPANADSVTVSRCVSSFEDFGTFPVQNGRFSFTIQLPKDEVCKLTVDKRGYTYFWADGQPIEANLIKRYIKSSKASQQRNNFVNDMETERLHRLRLDNLSEVDASLEKQRESYRQVIFKGNDDLLKAFALYKIYTELTYDELKPFISDRFRYANHLFLAPVKEYVAGLEKRRPGSRYTDIQLTDTMSNAHMLSEFIGKGYVVLHFWESWNRDQYDILPQLRTVYDKYHAKGLQILSLVIDGNYKKRWTDRLNEENLPWPQFTTRSLSTYGILSWPETILIAPDGTIAATPATTQELETELKRIYSTN
jgi:hypothetical protein